MIKLTSSSMSPFRPKTWDTCWLKLMASARAVSGSSIMILTSVPSPATDTTLLSKEHMPWTDYPTLMRDFSKAWWQDAEHVEYHLGLGPPWFAVLPTVAILVPKWASSLDTLIEGVNTSRNLPALQTFPEAMNEFCLWQAEHLWTETNAGCLLECVSPLCPCLYVSQPNGRTTLDETCLKLFFHPAQNIAYK